VVPQRVPSPPVGIFDLGTDQFGGDFAAVAAGGFGVVGDGVDGEVLPGLGCLLPGQQGFDPFAPDFSGRFHGFVIGDQGFPFGFLLLGHWAFLCLGSAVVAFVLRAEAQFLPVADDGLGMVLAPVVGADDVAVGVLVGGRFAVGAVGPVDVQVFLVGVVSGAFDQGLALGDQFFDQGRELGLGFPVVPELLGDPCAG
jgi:hypothetical protein